MIDTTTAKKLAMQNSNNKFNCDGFVDLHFAPPEDGIITEYRYDRIYVVKNGEDSIFVKLVDYAVFKFSQVSTTITIAATGMEHAAWKKDWMMKYPQTTDNTMMAAYCYQRLK